MCSDFDVPYGEHYFSQPLGGAHRRHHRPLRLQPLTTVGLTAAAAHSEDLVGDYIKFRISNTNSRVSDNYFALTQISRCTKPPANHNHSLSLP